MKSIKKILLLFIAAGLAFSCSDDSEESYIPEATYPVVKKITTTGAHNRTYVFTYDNLRRINKISVSGDVNRIYTLGYNIDNLITTIAYQSGSSVNYELHYNENKIYEGYSRGNDDSWATYDELTKTYSLYTVFGNGVTVKEDSEHDLDFIHDNDDDDAVTFHYANAVKGPFANVPGNIHFALSLFDTDFMLFATKKALSGASMPLEPDYYKYTNEVYSGFVAEADFVSDNMTMHINYDYVWVK